MVLSIPAAWNTLVQRAHQATPWLWLWEITAESTTVSTPTLAVVDNPEPIVCDGVTFNPFPIRQSPMEQTTDGSMPTLELQLDNTGQILARYVEETEGFMDRECTLRFTNHDDLTKFVQFTFRVAACSLTPEVLSIKLELDNWFQRTIPQDTFHVHRCRHRFGSVACGYIVNQFAAYTTCAKHIADCKLRGDDMATRNLGRRQPESFGAFLGVPLT